MAETTGIAWTDSTFNAWMGCTKVSEACRFCYAERDTKRWGRVIWGDQAQRIRTSDDYWNQPLSWERQAIRDGKRRKVFCSSLADVFEDRPELVPWRDDLLQLIENTPHLDWQLLTKRPQNMVHMTEHRWRVWPDNVWAGTSTEDQGSVFERVGHLLKVPARIRFLSCEPLLGPLRLVLSHLLQQAPIQWVIVGGESGPEARPMHPIWARSIRDQCAQAGVAFFFKQWGEWAPREDLTDRYWNGETIEEVQEARDFFRVVNLEGGQGFHGEEAILMKKIGKKAAGDLLDGVRHQEFPATGVLRA